MDRWIDGWMIDFFFFWMCKCSCDLFVLQGSGKWMNWTCLDWWSYQEEMLYDWRFSPVFISLIALFWIFIPKKVMLQVRIIIKSSCATLLNFFLFSLFPCYLVRIDNDSITTDLTEVNIIHYFTHWDLLYFVSILSCIINNTNKIYDAWILCHFVCFIGT